MFELEPIKQLTVKNTIHLGVILKPLKQRNNEIVFMFQAIVTLQVVGSDFFIHY